MTESVVAETTQITKAPSKGAKRSTARDSRGRFVLGHNEPGPGNPLHRRVHAMRRAISEAITTKDMENVIHAMIERALDGDVLAAKLLLERGAGKVPELLSIQGGAPLVKIVAGIDADRV